MLPSRTSGLLEFVVANEAIPSSERALDSFVAAFRAMAPMHLRPRD